MNLYAPIDTIAQAPAGLPRGLIVSAILPRLDDAPEPIAVSGQAVAEMASPAAVGEVTELRRLGEGLFIRARITAPVVARKIEEGVYRDLMLTIAGNGHVERVALVDRPDAFGKRAGHNPAAAIPLSLSVGAFSMSMSMPEIVHAIRRADPQRRQHVADTLLNAYLAEHGRAKTAAVIGEVLRKASAPAAAAPSVLIDREEAALIARNEREREEHRHRLAKREGKPADDFTRPLDRLGALELFKASRLRPIRPGFAFGVGAR